MVVAKSYYFVFLGIRMDQTFRIKPRPGGWQEVKIHEHGRPQGVYMWLAGGQHQHRSDFSHQQIDVSPAAVRNQHAVLAEAATQGRHLDSLPGDVPSPPTENYLARHHVWNVRQISKDATDSVPDHAGIG